MRDRDLGFGTVLNLVFALLFLARGPDALAGPATHMLGGRSVKRFSSAFRRLPPSATARCGRNGLAANGLVTIEALVGLMYQALATGLLFARFARPTTAIVFSRQAILAPYAGMESLHFRIANRLRRNEIIELEAQVLYTSFETNDRGQLARRYGCCRSNATR
jgi:inward rectifier potassium channel